MRRHLRRHFGDYYIVQSVTQAAVRLALVTYRLVYIVDLLEDNNVADTIIERVP